MTGYGSVHAGDIGAAPIRRYPGLGGYRCIGAAQIWNPRCRHNVYIALSIALRGSECIL